MSSVRIGARKGDHVELELEGGGGGVDVAFAASAAGVRAADRARLARGDLARFRDALRALDEGRDVEASLVTIERSLHVRVARDGARFHADCLVTEPRGGTVIKLGFALDAAKLAELLWALDGAVRDVDGG